MLNFLPVSLLYLINSLLLVINTTVWACLISLGGIIKLFVPFVAGRNFLTKIMNQFMWIWATCNGGILFLLTDIEWDIQGLENLDKNSWYLMISNH